MIVETRQIHPEEGTKLEKMIAEAFAETGCPGFAFRGTEGAVGAFTDGELIGYFELTGFADFARIARLALAVKPDSRGCGVGRKLLRLAGEAARKRGFSTVVVPDLPAGNHAAELFESECYTRLGRLKGAIIRNEREIDGLFYQLKL